MSNIFKRLNGNTMNVLTIAIMLVGWGINIGIVYSRIGVVEQQVIEVKQCLEKEQDKRESADRLLWERIIEPRG